MCLNWLCFALARFGLCHTSVGRPEGRDAKFSVCKNTSCARQEGGEVERGKPGVARPRIRRSGQLDRVDRAAGRVDDRTLPAVVLVKAYSGRLLGASPGGCIHATRSCFTFQARVSQDDCRGGRCIGAAGLVRPRVRRPTGGAGLENEGERAAYRHHRLRRPRHGGCRACSQLNASKPDLLNDKLPDDAKRVYVSNDHMGNFMKCVKTRTAPICPAEVGHRSASMCHLGVIAIRLGRKLQWDAAKEQFVGDAEANKWVAREMRKGYDYGMI